MISKLSVEIIWVLSNYINEIYVNITIPNIYISKSITYNCCSWFIVCKNWQNVSIMFNIMFKTLNINFILLLDDVFTKHNSFCVIQNGLIIKGATFNSYHYWTSVIAKKITMAISNEREIRCQFGDVPFGNVTHTNNNTKL